LADAIKNAHGLEAELIEGAGGIFDVRLDGDLIFSKQEVGRFPEQGEILDRLGAWSG
jgi:selenoprotein W-related protein